MKRLLLLAALPALIISGCSHEPDEPIAGKGGNAKLIVYPQHHGKATALDSVIVYIKYNSSDAPVNGVYDDSATCTYINQIPSCSFDNLWNGKYYIYGKGYDYEYNQRVLGGTFYTITSQQQITINIPVSEDSGH